MTILIGIDPGVNTGYAVWDPHGFTLHRVETLGAIEAMERVRSMCKPGIGVVPDTIHLFVEDCREMYVPRDQYNKARLKGVGSVQRDVKIWEEFAAFHNITIHLPKPGKYRKLTAQQFAQFTGWTQRTSEHARAAAMQVYGIRANDFALREMRA